MNRALILPAFIAAGLHALLLGFKSSPPVAATTDQSGPDDDALVTQIFVPEPLEPPEPQNFEPAELPPPAPVIPQGA